MPASFLCMNMIDCKAILAGRCVVRAEQCQWCPPCGHGSTMCQWRQKTTNCVATDNFCTLVSLSRTSAIAT